ncbi:MAG: alpha-galactosidase [Chlorobi bacterium]|nr:alpha-galactosidase [Chlorobiota bacterium]
MKKISLFTGILFIVFLFTTACIHSKVYYVQLEDYWKFHPGDSLAWADPAFNDQDWTEISPSKAWEKQGYEALNGYAWYRTKFFLPSGIRKSSFFNDTLILSVGKIDDADQVFLNGKFLGENNISYPPNTTPDKKIIEIANMWNTPRHYKIAVDDPRLKWDSENQLSFRVWDHGGLGGIIADRPGIRMRDIADYLFIDITSSPFKIEQQKKYEKTVLLTNRYPKLDFSGKLEIEVKDNSSGEVIFSKKKPVTIHRGEQLPETVSFAMDHPVSSTLTCRFIPQTRGGMVEQKTGVPYLLTPPVPDAARIHTSMVYGARPGHPFLYRIPVTGKRPITLQINGLPEGLVLNSEAQTITGTTPSAGLYPVQIIAGNAAGRDTTDMLIKAGNEIALTPPLGWNSWNAWGLSVDDAKVRAAADAFVQTGLADHGWTHINIDDGWEAPERLADGSITGNEKFPDFKDLSAYVHSKGLKLGIYSGPGPLTCGGYLASYQHEFQDAATWAGWGIDYIKYDWCSYNNIAKDHSLEELQKPYILMRKALDAVNRDIVYSLCQYGMGDVWKWGAAVGGNLWRTTGDIRDTWESMSGIGFRQNEMSPYASPGHWNDPDMLVVGWVGWGPNLHPTRLTPDEQYTHISLWSLLSAPLLIGCDLTRLDDFTLNLLTNDEVLAIDQDILGKQADKVYDRENIQYWVKEVNGGHATGIFNLRDKAVTVTVKISDLGLEGTFTIRDLWRQTDLGTFNDSFTVTIPPHGVVLVKMVSGS